MKELYLFSNCQGDELSNYLQKCMLDYRITIIASYTNLENLNILSDNKFEKCDILIMSNIKNYPHITPQVVRAYLKPTCVLIIMEFIRFNGFMPYNFILNIPSIHGADHKKEFKSYFNTKFSKEVIENHFQNELVKLKKLDEMSDIKFYDFFMTNYKKVALFRDHAHLTKIFMIHIVEQVLTIINEKTKQHYKFSPFYFDDIPHCHGFQFRITPILPCVKECLGLDYNEDFIDIFNYLIPKHEFIRFIENAHGNTLEALQKEIHLLYKETENQCPNKKVMLDNEIKLIYGRPENEIKKFSMKIKRRSASIKPQPQSELLSKAL